MSSLLPLIVLPLEPSDLPTVSLIYTTAFLPGAFGQALYSQADPKEITRLLDARLAKLTSKPRQKLLKAVRGGQIVGFAWFCEPEPETGAGAGSAGGDSEEPGEEPEEEAREFAPGTRVELLKQFGNDLEAHAKTVVGRHWHRESSLGWGVATRWCKAACRCSSRYPPFIADVHTSLPTTVEQLGTHPDHQRTGAATALARWGIERASADGLDLHLDATIGRSRPLPPLLPPS